MLGAALGGTMVDTLGWRWEFGIQVPGLILAMIIAMVALPDDIGLYGKKREGIWEAMRLFDFKGSILMSSAITFLILGLVSPLNRSVIQYRADCASRTLEETSCRVSDRIPLPFGRWILTLVGSHPFVITSLVIFALCFPLFLYVETTAERPIMPLHFIQKAPYMNIIFSNFIASILVNAIFFNMQAILSHQVPIPG